MFSVFFSSLVPLSCCVSRVFFCFFCFFCFCCLLSGWLASCSLVLCGSAALLPWSWGLLCFPACSRLPWPLSCCLPPAWLACLLSWFCWLVFLARWLVCWGFPAFLLACWRACFLLHSPRSLSDCCWFLCVQSARAGEVRRRGHHYLLMDVRLHV